MKAVHILAFMQYYIIQLFRILKTKMQLATAQWLFSRDLSSYCVLMFWNSLHFFFRMLHWISFYASNICNVNRTLKQIGLSREVKWKGCFCKVIAKFGPYARRTWFKITAQSRNLGQANITLCSCPFAKGGQSIGKKFKGGPLSRSQSLSFQWGGGERQDDGGNILNDGVWSAPLLKKSCHKPWDARFHAALGQPPQKWCKKKTSGLCLQIRGIWAIFMEYGWCIHSNWGRLRCGTV